MSTSLGEDSVSVTCMNNVSMCVNISELREEERERERDRERLTASNGTHSQSDLFKLLLDTTSSHSTVDSSLNTIHGLHSSKHTQSNSRQLTQLWSF